MESIDYYIKEECGQACALMSGLEHGNVMRSYCNLFLIRYMISRWLTNDVGSDEFILIRDVC